MMTSVILQSALLYTCEMCMMIFLGTFSKLQRATISFITSVRPSKWKNSAPIGQIFMKFDYFFKICWENSSVLKSDKNNKYFTWRPKYIHDNILLNFT